MKLNLRSTVCRYIACEIMLMYTSGEAIRNKSLFVVDGQERVLFDQKLNMDLSTFTSGSIHGTQRLADNVQTPSQDQSITSKDLVLMCPSQTYVPSYRSCTDPSSHQERPMRARWDLVKMSKYVLCFQKPDKEC